MITIAQALQHAASQFSPSETATLNAEVLLAHVLKVSRSHFHAWPERALGVDDRQAYAGLVARKIRGEPTAYITGTREFWSREFLVTPATLIPRPETELLVEKVLEKFAASEDVLRVADLGTGCGAIALTLALEKPHWQIIATDLSAAALDVAKRNAARLSVTHVSFLPGDWCNALPSGQFDAIMSNPPYIAKGDSELNRDVIESEPHSALFADEEGLQALRLIIFQAKKYLKSGGYLIVEHGHRQADAVTELFSNAGYNDVTVSKDLSNLDRVTMGCFLPDIVS